MSSNPDTIFDLDQALRQLQAGKNMPAELLEIFAEEADDHLQTIYDGLNRLRSDGADGDSLASVRRASHTLKGAAGAVGLEAATRLAHRMEDLLDCLAEKKQSASQQQVNLMLSTADMLQELTGSEVDIQAAASQLVEVYAAYQAELDALTHGHAKPSQSVNLDATNDTTTSPDEVTDGSDQELDPSPTPASTSELDTHSNTGREADRQKTSSASPPAPHLRVPLGRLDEMVGLVGEMIVNRSALDQCVEDLVSRINDMQSALDRLRNATQEIETDSRFPGGPSWTHGLAEHPANMIAMSRRDDRSPIQSEFDSLEFDQYNDFHLFANTITEANYDAEIVAGELRNLRSNFDNLLNRQQQLNRDAQQSLMKIRMVPLSGIVSRLERTVRTVSKKLGRQVELHVIGGHTELDKTVLDEITDPLLHLIRNALDHGIESPDDRKAVGKSPTASLTIEAVNQGTQITIRIADDGAGIDREKVREQAIRRQLIGEGQELADEELYNLLFVPGFSTAASVTDVSGRGVGMDVVRDTVARLKGTIRVKSQAGAGTTFTIQLPTTLGITRALIVESSGHRFAIPLAAVKEIKRLESSMVIRQGSDQKITVHEKVIRLFDLASHLQLPVRERAHGVGQLRPLLIVGAGDDQVAITVDSIRDGQEIVVKGFGNHLKKVPGLIGVTIRGDGTVIPILDPADLVGQTAAIQLARGLASQNPVSLPSRRNTAMVIDDSISVRRVTTNLLQSVGWDTSSAKDGIDALEKLEELDAPPDIFLCDMEMPRMDGIELIKQIRAQEEFALTPIVMVTSRASEKHRHLAFDAGATDYVVKPFNDEQLLQLITQLVQSARETVTV